MLRVNNLNRGIKMFENLYKAGKLSEHSMLFAQPKGTGDELSPTETLPFLLAYIEILPAGLIDDEI
jgi:hypothetical protein